MNRELPVTRKSFKVDTSRPRSRSKMRAKFRHIMAVASVMFPLMALFIWLVSFLRLPVERAPFFKMALIFVGCGMVSLLIYTWARANKLHRREVSARNRELRHQERAEAFRRTAESRETQAESPEA